MEEVAFQQGCQVAELRNVLTSALGQPQRKLSSMHSRIKKHLGATAPKLAAEVCSLRACHSMQLSCHWACLHGRQKPQSMPASHVEQWTSQMYDYSAWWLTYCRHDRERGGEPLSIDMLLHLCFLHVDKVS